MKPEWHIDYKTEECYLSEVDSAMKKNKYIKVSLSKECIGHLLQGKQVSLLFLNDDYELEGMLDIGLSDEENEFNVSNELNELIINN